MDESHQSVDNFDKSPKLLYDFFHFHFYYYF